MGSVRSVVDNVVVCPLGTVSSGTHCLACHFIEGSESDRLLQRGCSTEPIADLAEPQPGSPTASWPELIIELL